MIATAEHGRLADLADGQQSPKKKVSRSVLFQRRSYNTWRGMVERCTNPNHQQFRYYGGAGIKVCEEWLKYAKFFADMGEPLERTMQLDRVDSSKGYSLDNCRWATPSQNCANRRGWSKSGFKGVYMRPSGRFAAVMTVGRKVVTLGTFDDAVSAAKAFDAACVKRFGEFAKTNSSMGRVSP